MNVNVQTVRGGNLYEAHRQWASRPADECYRNVADLHAWTSRCCEASFQGTYFPGQLSVVEAGADDLQLALTTTGTAASRHVAQFTNFSFKQLCSHAKAPADFLSRMPASITQQALNKALELENFGSGARLQLLFQDATDDREPPYMRACTSDVYSRVWNADVTEWLSTFDPEKVAPPASRTSWQGTGTGLYASDHDMFAFLVLKPYSLDIPGHELVRGFYVSNNEVGTGSLKLCMFLCDYVCGNHIIWNVEQAVKISVRHVGNLDSSIFKEVFLPQIAYNLQAGAGADEQKVQAAMLKKVGENKEKVVEYLFEKRLATKKLAGAAFDYADGRVGIDPTSVWGIVQGLTRQAQATPFYDEREAIELGAAKLLASVN